MLYLLVLHVLSFGVSAGKRDQIDKKFFFEIINVLDQMIKSTSILLRNFFLKKISIWFLFPALTPFDKSILILFKIFYSQSNIIFRPKIYQRIHHYRTFFGVYWRNIHRYPSSA